MAEPKCRRCHNKNTNKPMILGQVRHKYKNMFCFIGVKVSLLSFVGDVVWHGPPNDGHQPGRAEWLVACLGVDTLRNTMYAALRGDV